MSGGQRPWSGPTPPTLATDHRRRPPAGNVRSTLHSAQGQRITRTACFRSWYPA